MNFEQLKALMSLVVAAYGSKFAPTEETASAWNWILEDLPAGAAIDALKRYIRSGSAFPPSPGEIYALAKKETDNKKLPAYQLFHQPPPVAKIKTASELVALAKTELSKKSKNKSVK